MQCQPFVSLLFCSNLIFISFLVKIFSFDRAFHKDFYKSVENRQNNEPCLTVWVPSQTHPIIAGQFTYLRTNMPKPGASLASSLLFGRIFRYCLSAHFFRKGLGSAIAKEAYFEWKGKISALSRPYRVRHPSGSQCSFKVIIIFNFKRSLTVARQADSKRQCRDMHFPGKLRSIVPF
jgi:hypothetical protein